MKKTIIILAILICGIIAYLSYQTWSRPAIELIGVSSDSVISMKDTLSVNLKFEDKDGDIGDTAISLSRAYIEDTAYAVVQEFPIISRTSMHSLGAVTGRLRVLVNILPLLDTTMQRTTRLKIYITDRKGHKSNVVETPVIHLFRNEF